MIETICVFRGWKVERERERKGESKNNEGGERDR